MAPLPPSEQQQQQQQSPTPPPAPPAPPPSELPTNRRLSTLLHHHQPHHREDRRDSETQSLISSYVSKDERALLDDASLLKVVGERLPYNDYTTIDWLHDLVKSSYRSRSIRSKKGLRGRFLWLWESCSGWLAVAVIGIVTACVAFCVDVAEATVSDWKQGYCRRNVFADREACCTDRSPLAMSGGGKLWGQQQQQQQSVGTWDRSLLGEGKCADWVLWKSTWGSQYAVYTAWALLFGLLSSSLTMLTRSNLPSIGAEEGQGQYEQAPKGKSIYLAAGSGIPEIKTILSGFQIPHILDLKVLVVKAVGAVFAVATGMCLGKEGPFVHISTCVAYLVGSFIPKYRDNSRKMRELLSAGCSSGLSVAFGAPIGGVLFSYEEISTYFPRKVLWRAFFCSLWAAMILKALNPTGTGKLVLFETNYGTAYSAFDYFIFIILGVAGGLWGGIFCKLNFLWSKTFRQLPVIKSHPVFEVFLVTLITALSQYPNPMTQEPGDKVIKNLLQDCRRSSSSWLCRQESIRNSSNGPDSTYVGWLLYGTLIKLFLTTITFGCKVPSGIIIPALDAGAFFGRLIGQYVTDISPGIFAMVGAAAFLAGVSRMTISLCVIMFELTGELEYIVPHMIAILVAKWVADALEKEGVYDLAQTVLGHPFLDLASAMDLVTQQSVLVEELIPPEGTMRDITVTVPKHNKVARKVLVEKLARLKARGLMDAGLVLVQDGMLQGYLAEGELDFGLERLGAIWHDAAEVRLLGEAQAGEFDLSSFVDRTPLTICAKAPMEYCVEMFGKLGLRQLCVVEERTGKLVGVIIKKRLVTWLDSLKS